MKVISQFALLILVVALLFLAFTGNLFSSSPLVIAGQVLAVLLAVWARRSFTAQFSIQAAPAGGGIISSGPYHFIRHPMYAAALLLIWVSIAGHWSLLNAGIGVGVTAVILIRIAAEETLLQASYPDYLAYAGQTKRLVPFLF